PHAEACEHIGIGAIVSTHDQRVLTTAAKITPRRSTSSGAGHDRSSRAPHAQAPRNVAIHTAPLAAVRRARTLSATARECWRRSPNVNVQNINRIEPSPAPTIL